MVSLKADVLIQVSVVKIDSAKSFEFSAERFLMSLGRLFMIFCMGNLTPITPVEKGSD